MKEFANKHKKGLIILAILLILVIVGIVGVLRIKKKVNEVMAMMTVAETEVLQQRELSNTLSASGKIVAKDTTAVFSTLTGQEIEKLNFEVGDRIKEGDVICVFDTTVIEENLESSEKSLEAQKASQDIKLSASQRSLAQAQSARDIALEDADEEIAQAWAQYLAAVDRLIVAENDYDNRINYGEPGEDLGYHERGQELAVSIEGYNMYQAGFNSSLSALRNMIDTKSSGFNSVTATSALSFTNPYLEDAINSFREERVYREGLCQSEEMKNEADDYLDAMLSQWKAIFDGMDPKYIQGASSFMSIQKSDATDKDALFSTYLSAKNSADSALRAYEMKVKAKRDTDTKTAQSIQAEQDALKSAKITESTTGIAEEQTIRNYERQLEKKEVLAPISGTVTSVSVQEGAVYAGGTILEIQDDSAYMVSAEISEYDILNVKVGQRVVVRTKGTGDEEFEGVVDEIAPRATATVGNASNASTSTTYNVKVALDNKGIDLMLDMNCTMNIYLEEPQTAYAVSDTAINVDPESGKEYILVGDQPLIQTEADSMEQSGDDPAFFSYLDDEGELQMMTTKRIYVTRGTESSYYVEIYGNELRDGLIVLDSLGGSLLTDPGAIVDGSGPMGGM